MKKLLFPCLLAISISTFLIGCSSSTHLSDNAGDNQKVGKWFKSRDWLNGLQLTPHESINQQEFSRQYNINKVWWDKAFNFLKTHDLPNLKPGSYVIDSGNVIATVSELNPKEKDQVNFEAHRNFNDLQYVIKGKVQMGVTSISDPNAKVTVPYAP
ncbi:MAG: hypothetical protein JWQ09_4737, partial [Segetibacter sp.]|nr:hypothetical protein [Segetibacter sp.]